MYYYIAESLATSTERQRVEAIKSLLSQLGIAGEFAIASPARSVEEHLELAFAKGFTTIVGIGSDALVSRVAGQMLSRHYEKAVLGAIPFQPDQALWQMIGASSLTAHGQALRERRTIFVDALELGRGQAIISPASMLLDRLVRFRLDYNDVQLLGVCRAMTVDPSGEVTLRDTPASKGWFSGFFRRIAGSSLAVTRFTADSWRLATERPVQLVIGGQIVAETPFEAKRWPKALKLIIQRATIAPVKDRPSLKE